MLLMNQVQVFQAQHEQWEEVTGQVPLCVINHDEAVTFIDASVICT